MTKNEALQMALETLEEVQMTIATSNWLNKRVEALRAALAQRDVPETTFGETKPVAFINPNKRRIEFASPYVRWNTPTTVDLPLVPLYTAPPQRKPLTRSQLFDVVRRAHNEFCSDKYTTLEEALVCMVEAAHGIGEVK